MRKWRSKYKNKKSRYKNRVYHSRREAGDAMWLDSLLKQGLIKEVIPQYRIRFEINGLFMWSHIVDFLVILNDGRKKFCETKGWPTLLWQRNVKMCKVLYPEIKYLTNPGEKELLE